MSQGTTPPGWYDDGQGAERWWDGVRWTEQTRPGQQPAWTPQPPQPPQPPYGAPQQASRGKGPLIAAVAGVVALLVVAAVVLVVVLGGDDGKDDDRADDPTTTATSEPTTATSPASPTSEPTSEAPTEPEPSEPFEPDPSDPGPAPAGSASATVEDFFDTVRGGDCDAVDFLSNKTIGVSESERADALTAAKAGCGEGGFFGDQDIAGCTFVLGQETGDDRAAEVDYDVTECDDVSNNESGTLRLIVESGEWRIDDFQSS